MRMGNLPTELIIRTSLTPLTEVPHRSVRNLHTTPEGDVTRVTITDGNKELTKYMDSRIYSMEKEKAFFIISSVFENEIEKHYS